LELVPRPELGLGLGLGLLNLCRLLNLCLLLERRHLPFQSLLQVLKLKWERRNLQCLVSPNHPQQINPSWPLLLFLQKQVSLSPHLLPASAQLLVGVQTWQLFRHI
jgi:hypothetical protein